MSLDKLDLNLLRFMLTLLEANTVTEAAHRLNLSQSAVSKQLARLREQVGEALQDPLFVRDGKTIKPTARAKALEPQLRSWLQSSCEMLRAEHFNPSLDQREFTISITESAFPVVVPLIFPLLAKNAPNIKLHMVPQTHECFNKLTNNQLDFLIVGRDLDKRTRAPWHVSDLPNFPKQQLYRDKNVCLVCKTNTDIIENWSLKTFLSAPQIHIWVEGSTTWLLDWVLASQGHYRDKSAVVPNFDSAALLAQHSEMLFTCASEFADELSKRYNLEILPIPIELEAISYQLLWPKAQDLEPGHQWLREFIVQQCASLGQPNPNPTKSERK